MIREVKFESLLNRLDTVLVQCSKNLFDTTVLALEFYFSNHSSFLLIIIRDVDQCV